MLTTSRKALLLERLNRDGQLMVSLLAKEFNLSADTLRRDMRELAAEGKLIRVHGGAVAASPTHQALSVRRKMLSNEKKDLAQTAAQLIKDDLVVIVDGGTTHSELAAAIPQDRRCTVVTHSPIIAASFEFHSHIEILLIGGKIFRHSMVAVGAETAEAFSRVNADLCLLGVTGIHPKLGITTGDADEAAVKRVMMKAAAETAILATSDKINHASSWQISNLTHLSTLVTVNQRPEWLPIHIDHIPT